MAALNQENCILRKQLTEVQGQLERLQASLQLMTGTIVEALDKRRVGVAKGPGELQELQPAERAESKGNSSHVVQDERSKWFQLALSATGSNPGGDCQTLYDNTTSESFVYMGS
jgi:hypothetical protein